MGSPFDHGLGDELKEEGQVFFYGLIDEVDIFCHSR